MAGLQSRLVKLEAGGKKPQEIVVETDGELRIQGRLITVDELRELEKTNEVIMIHVVYDQTPIPDDEGQTPVDPDSEPQGL